jgi:hypothetical protein
MTYIPPPPAGWHPDPEVPGGLRYWDGAQWTEHRQAPPEPAIEAARQAKAKRSNRRTAWVIFGAFGLVVAVCGGAAIFGALHPTDPMKGDHSGAAVAYCEQAVSRRLKAPGTADYGNESAHRAGDGTGQEYAVSGTVDSENGFGAKLRSSFSCYVTQTPDGWRIDRLTLD